MDLTAKDLSRLLREHQLERPQAESALKLHQLHYSDASLNSWLTGEVVPSLMRCIALLTAAEVEKSTRDAFARTISKDLVGEDLAQVSLLCRGSKAGGLEQVRQALRNSVIIDGWDETQHCALHYAARDGHCEIARLLFESGSSPMAILPRFETCWATALKTGRSSIIKLFLEYGCVVSDEHGMNRSSSFELVAGSHADEPDAIEALMQSGHFANATLRPAMRRAAMAGNLNILRYLIDRGIDVGTFDQERNRPLDLAAEAGQMEALRLLLDAGAALNAANTAGDTALHKAARAGHRQIARLLLELGADPALRNAAGESAASMLGPSDAPKRRGPSWFNPEGTPVLFLYSKADGLGFDPRNVDSPLLFGGDYDGIMPASPGFLLGADMAAWRARYKMEWLLPFLQKLSRREDFSMEELLDAARAAGIKPFTRRF